VTHHPVEGTRLMNTMMLHATVKPECVTDVESAVQEMFAAIDAAAPDGVRYASCRSSDGVSFVALLALDEGIENPLPAIAEFRDFQANLGQWLAAPPVPDQMTVVGSYRLF
jgi:hypothetical protein